MKEENNSETSSSEDEACLEALREAADQNFLKNSLFSNEKKEIDVKSVIAAERQDTIGDNGHDDEVDESYPHHGLSQTCRDFIAKKLNERLERNIVLKHDSASESPSKADIKQELGIKLFTSSRDIVTEIETVCETQEVSTRQTIKNPKFNEKSHRLKCQEVAVEPDLILAQHDVKHWTNRKCGKIFKYKRLKNGKLSEIL